MDWDRRRYDDRRGGESYRPSERPGRSPSRGYDSRRRSPPRNRSRPRADTWVPSHRSYGRPRSRSPEYRRRSRTPPFQGRGYGPSSYSRRRSPPRRFSPRRDDRTRTPPRAWRSRSPLNNDIRPREMSRGRNTPKRVMRDPTPSSQDFRTARPASPVARNTDRPPRAPSPVSQPPLAIRPQNIADAIPREPDVDKRERPSSRTRQEPISPVPVPVPVPAPAPAPAPTSAAGAATESGATSRRSSPSMYPDRSRAASTRSHSRSPFRRSPSFRPPTGPRGRSPYRDSRRDSEHSGPRRPMDESAPGSGQIPTGPSHMNDGRSPGPIPTQPRNANLYQQPPSGPSQGPKMGGPGSGRGPQNMSLLSAPTRPRRGPGSRDSPWSGPPMARRGPPASPAAHSPPVGPRASFSGMSGTGGGHYRHPGSRQHSIASGNPPPRSKSLNHLAGISALVPGGKALPSILDPAAERRLVQLEADRERLFEQVMTTQKIKRAGLRDWDRVDRESSICALKSELAEGHLQRMAEESSIAGGVLF